MLPMNEFSPIPPTRAEREQIANEVSLPGARLVPFDTCLVHGPLPEHLDDEAQLLPSYGRQS
jgi:hypothetical protein